MANVTKGISDGLRWAWPRVSLLALTVTVAAELAAVLPCCRRWTETAVQVLQRLASLFRMPMREIPEKCY